MKLVTNKSKNLLYRIQPFVNCTVDFQTSYAVLKQTTADTYNLSFKGQLFKGVNYAGVALFSGEPISSVGKFTKTFTTASTLPDYNTVVFGLNGATNDTTFKCAIQLKPSTTYTFTCNFTNITQGSISWKDMMLVEGSEAGDYEPYSYNLLDKYKFGESNSNYINNGDGSITTTGTVFSFQRLFMDFDSEESSSISKENSIAYLTYGHKLLINDNSNSTGTDQSNAAGYIWEINSSSANAGSSYGGKGEIFTNNKLALADIKWSYFYMTNNSGETVTCAPALYDLTLMYGAGNEPTTVEQFYTDYPELKVSPLGFIELKNLEINNKNIKRLRYATTTRNLFDKSRAIKGFELNNSQGGTIANLTWFVSDYISVVGINTLTISGKVSGGASNCFYDNNHNFISTVIMLNGAFQVPSGATYMRFNGLLTEIDTAQLESGSIATPYVPYGYLDLGIIPSNIGIH